MPIIRVAGAYYLGTVQARATHEIHTRIQTARPLATLVLPPVLHGNGGCVLSASCADPEGFNRVAQSVILGLESRGLVLQSLAKIGDLMLLLLNSVDDRRKQFAVGNAISPILVVLPLDQGKPVSGFRSLNGLVQRCRQSLLKVLRDEPIALGVVAIVKTIGHWLE